MDLKLILIAIALAIVLAILAHKKERVLPELLLAIAIAGLWTWYFPYQYVGKNYYLMSGINAYSFTLWFAGLVWLSSVYRAMTMQYRLLIASILYWLVLAGGEAYAYHVLGIRLNSSYPSLFGLGIIHAPLGVKVFYILAGPLYLTTVELMYRAHGFSKTKKNKIKRKVRELLFSRIN